ncbi:MAG: DUF2283 domain-containing protein [Acidimicrobiia bacterium]|nr:DUF2283 domain-containing protein [Acidimicrobiia bacterium]
MKVTYDPEGDLIYVTVRPDREERGGRRLDSSRILYVDEVGTAVAYEFLWASNGISLEGIHPDDQDLIRQALSQTRPYDGTPGSTIIM